MSNELKAKMLAFLQDYLADHNTHDHEGVEHESSKRARKLIAELEE